MMSQEQLCEKCNYKPSGKNRTCGPGITLRQFPQTFLTNPSKLRITKDIFGKKLSKLEKLQSLVAKCCKIRKI
jgi:hypothetical protein